MIFLGRKKSLFFLIGSASHFLSACGLGLNYTLLWIFPLRKMEDTEGFSDLHDFKKAGVDITQNCNDMPISTI
jgi:hypothetical protein